VLSIVRFALCTLTLVALAGHAEAQTSSVSGFVSTPQPRTAVASSFTIAGRASDSRASSGPGVDAIHVWAAPVAGGDSIFAGSTTALDADGSFSFTATGLTAGGDYTLSVSAHSTVDNAMHGVTVVSPVTAASVSAADITRITTTASGAGTSGGQIAYDDKHDVVLQVWNGAGNAVTARFIRLDGTPAGDSFDILPDGFSASADAVVAYSRGAADDLFFVVFTGTFDDSTQRVTGQFLRYTGTGSSAGAVIGGPIAISARVPSARPADVVHNPVSRQFFVMWSEGPSTQLFARSFAPDGAPVTDLVALAPGTETLPDARVDVDWARNRYCVVFTTQTGRFDTGYLVHGLILDGTTAESLSTRPLIGNITTPLSGAVAFVAASGACLGAVDGWNVTDHWLEERANSSTPWTTHPSPSAFGPGPYVRPGLAHDTVSMRSLVVAEGVSSRESEWVVLDREGKPLSVPFALIPGAHFADIVATRDGRFAFSYLRNGIATLEQIGLPAATVPGPQFSNVVANIDAPPDHAARGSAFTIRGWAIDFGATSGTGIDAIHAWAFPTGGGSPVFLGAAGTFVDRPDLASQFGSRFTNAGFEIPVRDLPLGAYTLAVYPHSTVTGAFASPRTVRVTIESRPVMNLDLPGDGATVTPGFDVGGWAIDLAADSGGGVDTVHVWAFPTGGGSPVFLGAAPVDRARPDIAAAFGSQFENAGFRLTSAALPEGRYLIVAYAHSTVSGTFNNSGSAEIRVVPPVSNPAMALDTPANGATVSGTFLLAGWAIDRGASSGTGVDVLHAWAFPSDGKSPIFLGTPEYGFTRGDVGGIFGAQFTKSGYNLAVSSLDAGTYQLVVYARSTVTGTFNQWRVVNVSVDSR
jgi:hypothetical protein